MRLFVGLGNPGAQYAMHRHNIGFMALDVIKDMHDFPASRKKFQGHYTEGNLGSCKTGLLKPETFMNNSGQAVAAAAKFYKIPADKIVVFHDELDLPPGRVKIKKSGGTAGHNGLKSIAAHLGTQDFWRVRLGIGHPGDKSKVSGYVLHDFSKAEQDWLPDFLGKIGNNAELLFDEKQHSRFIEAVGSAHSA